MADDTERLKRAAAEIRERLAGFFDDFDATERSNDIVQALAIYRGNDPIGDIREMLEPRKGHAGIEGAERRAAAAVECYRVWLRSARARR